MVLSCTRLGIPNNVLTLMNNQYFRRISLFSGCWKQNHYEVLGLKESCSNAEIKAAFFKKIKLLHPDKNGQNPECHDLVISVNEAYSVLSKDHTRTSYDYQLARERGQFYSDSIERDDMYERVIFHDHSFWENRDRSNDHKYKEKPYYGIKGIKRLPNHYVATGVIIFMIIGAIIHFYIAKISTSYALRQLDKRSALANEQYLKAREMAMLNGNLKQINLLMEKNQIKLSNEKVAEK